jgi:hypothetical protein
MLGALRSPVRSAIRSAARSAFTRVGASWSPASLFAAGEQGAWYDPSDFSSMFQDSAGTTPVTAVEQPVGLILDKRLGSPSTLGPQLFVNPDFSSGSTGWTLGAGWSVSGGQAVNSGSVGAIRQDILTIGKWYIVEFDIVAVSNWLLVSIGGGGNVSFTTTGRKQMIALAASTSCRFDIQVGGHTATIDNTSIREVYGNHALQATSTARPTTKSDSGYASLGILGGDDNTAAVAGGGGTTAGTWVIGFRPDLLGTLQAIWSDAGANTGYRIRFTAANQIEFSAGNGAAYTAATVATALTLGQRCVITAWHDGANLNVQVDNGTVATAAFVTATAGTAAVTLGKDNGAASGYLTGRIYDVVYVKDVAESAADRALAKTYVGASAGVVL